MLIPLILVPAIAFPRPVIQFEKDKIRWYLSGLFFHVTASGGGS